MTIVPFMMTVVRMRNVLTVELRKINVLTMVVCKHMDPAVVCKHVDPAVVRKRNDTVILVRKHNFLTIVVCKR